MSIKNIIQQENDLQEMSQQSLRNYLNSPTGQYNPYLVAGELQRKEQYAERKMVEAPQQTVVDELVQNTMPMGGMPQMPMGGMPQMPRPQEAMVSDTITETGIANLPAPNIGQNYAEGGIIGYDDGGEVGFLDQVRDFDYKGFLNDRLENAGRGLDERSARNAEMFRIYKETGSFPEMTEEELDDSMAFLPGAGLKSVTNKGIKTATPYVKKAVDYVKDKFKSTPNKKTPPTSKTTTPPQTALEKANQFKDTRSATQKIKDKAKELYRSTSPDKGPLTRAGIAALRGTGQGVGPLTRGVKTGATRYPVESLLGLGALGYGLSEYFGETEEEAEIRKRKEFYNSEPEVRKRADEAKELQNAKNEQERANIAEKQRRAAKRRAYLALALGGAKTMAGQSQYALTNIGEGMGTGVAGLVELEEADANRQATLSIAEQKSINDLYKENLSQMNTFNELKKDLRGGDDPTFTQIFLGRLDDKGIDPADITNPEYIAIENQTILDLYPGASPRGSTMVAGQPFVEA